MLVQSFVSSFWPPTSRPDAVAAAFHTAVNVKEKPEEVQIAERFREKWVELRGGVAIPAPESKAPLSVEEIVQRLEAANFTGDEDSDEFLTALSRTRAFEKQIIRPLRRAYWTSC